MYRAFYKPHSGKYHEAIEDSDTLEGLSSGAILVIKINENGTRELISEKNNPSPKEKYYIDYGKRQLEYKYDGGTTPEHITMLREKRGIQ
jgi:hypothetical protein